MYLWLKLLCNLAPVRYITTTLLSAGDDADRPPRTSFVPNLAPFSHLRFCGIYLQRAIIKNPNERMDHTCTYTQHSSVEYFRCVVQDVSGGHVFFNPLLILYILVLEHIN